MTPGRHGPGITLQLMCFATAVLSCSKQAQQISPAVCEPFEEVGKLADQDIAALAGTYSLTLIAMSGDRAGITATGTLTLSENPQHLRAMSGPGGPMTNVTVPFHGTMDLNLSSLGALELGDPRSDDAMRPGVLAVRNAGAATNTFTIRIGSEANQRDRQQFDGGYTVLRVRHIDGGEMRGVWASGIRTEVASGYFCASTN